jgi:hypothetical protein
VLPKAFEYEFELAETRIGKILFAKNNDCEQSVDLRLRVVEEFGREWRNFDYTTIKLNIGYHCRQFVDGSGKKLFNEFGREYNRNIILPVIFEIDSLQMIGFGDIVVSQFGILDSKNYRALCKRFKVRPKASVVDFLNNLYKTYS